MALDWTANLNFWNPLVFGLLVIPYMAEDCFHVLNYRGLHLKKDVDILFINLYSAKCQTIV